MASRNTEPVMDTNDKQGHDDIPQIRNIRTLKSLLSRAIGQIINSEEEEIVSTTIEEYRDSSNLLNKRFRDLEEAVEESASNLKDPSKLYENFDEYNKRYIEAHKIIKARIREAKAISYESMNKSDKENLRRLDKTLKPFVLRKSHSPTDLRLWIKQVYEYLESGDIGATDNLSEEELKAQRTHLSRCLNVELLKMLEQRTKPNMPVFGTDGCIETIGKVFAVLYPIFYRRMALFQMKQDGENNTSYLERIHRNSLEAEFDTLDREGFCLLHFAVTLEDEKLREKIIAMENPTYAKATCLVAKYDATQVSTKAIKSYHSPDIIAAYGTNKKENRRNGNRFQSGKPNISYRKPCERCGRTNHDSSQCGVLTKGISCKACGKRGHLATVCRSLPMKAFEPTNDEENENHDDQYNHDVIHPEVTPRLKVKISHDEGNFSFRAFPDSGGCITMIATNLAKKKGITINNQTKTPKFIAVNGDELQIDGTCTLRITNLHNDITKSIVAIVSPDVLNDFIIGFPQLKELKVISEKFPISAYTIGNKNDEDFSEMKDTICNEFPDVVHDSLPETAMAGPPMNIKLTANAKPFKILTARPIPIHYQKEADALIKDMIDKCVIAKVDGITEWTAPTFLIPKNKTLCKSAKNNLRLVTDLSCLNKYIVQPVHPFPSAHTILSNIPDTARVFASLDAVSGYHQVPLDDKSSHLTTFLLPSGRYRYLRAPMGLCSSSDEWCWRSDATIEGIPGVHKLVDDYLVTGKDREEVLQRI